MGEKREEKRVKWRERERERERERDGEGDREIANEMNKNFKYLGVMWKIRIGILSGQ